MGQGEAGAGEELGAGQEGASWQSCLPGRGGGEWGPFILEYDSTSP